MTSNDRIEAALAALDKTTKGPWKWYGNTRSKEIYLATINWSRTFIMDFVRYGMNNAAPRFQVRDEFGNGVMYRVDELANKSLNPPDHNGCMTIDHPDALLIAAAPDLAAEVIRLRKWQSEAMKLIDGCLAMPSELADRLIAEAKGE